VTDTQTDRERQEPAPATAEPGGADAETAAAPSEHRLKRLVARIRSLFRAIQDGDEKKIEEAVLRLSRSRKMFAPLAFAVGAVAVLFDALKLIVTHWRLTLVSLLPAMWIWLAMFDLKLHVLHGKSFHVIRGPILIPLALLVVAITAGCFFLNAVFAFAIAEPPPKIRSAFATARKHLAPILASGSIVGLLLAGSVLVVPRWHRPWFALCLGVVVGVMMVSYVAVPGRLIGVKKTQSRRDKLITSGISGAISATVCTPPYVLGRVGLLLLGTRYLFILGIVLFALGVTLQAGATGAVRAIKMSASLRPRAAGEQSVPEQAQASS
jgi:hypothetical protein